MPLDYLPVSPKGSKRSFRVLDLEELTDEELRQVNLQITAHYHAELLLTTAPRVDPPEPYQERFSIWKMLLQQFLALVCIVIALVFIVLSAQAFGGMSALTLFYLGGAFLVYAWFAYRIFYSWQHTLVFSEAQDTGIRRKRNPWLIVSEKTPSTETSTLTARDADRNHFTSMLNINSWYVTLDSAVQKDTFLQMGFVRDGARLRQTVIDWQAYLKSARR